MNDDGDIRVLADGPDPPRAPDRRARRRRGAALAAVLTISLLAVVGVAIRDRGERQAATPATSSARRWPNATPNCRHAWTRTRPRRNR
ncbi:hypothetical protein [Virgisporangium aurantiacum]|nr:hypothetical protein [Virgisporangium aurantiacum]